MSRQISNGIVCEGMGMILSSFRSGRLTPIASGVLEAQMPAGGSLIYFARAFARPRKLEFRQKHRKGLRHSASVD